MMTRNMMVPVGVVILGMAGILALYMCTSTMRSTSGVPAQVVKVKEAMRELWAMHVIWTREYIVSQVANASDLSAVTERLLRNQDDIGNAVVPYYGKEAGQALAKLLREHILIGAAVVKAAQKDDKKALTEADEQWHKNAQELAAFLNKANPDNWPYQMLVDMFYEHLKLTTGEAVAHIKHDAAADIKAFDEIFAQAMKMADDLSNGIVQQFPDKFK